MLIIVLSGLIVVQCLTIYFQNRLLSRQRNHIQRWRRQRRVREDRERPLRMLATDPSRNAIGGWLALQQVEKTMPEGANRRAIIQGMRSLENVIWVTMDDYPQEILVSFFREQRGE